MTRVCKHRQSGKCDVVGELCGVPGGVAVTEEDCQRCQKPANGEQQDKNSVTAYLAMKHLAQNDQEVLKTKRPELEKLINRKAGGCGQSTPIGGDVKTLLLRSNQSPGDIMTMTAAVYSLHASYPQRFKTAVSTTCMEIWENNPLVHVLAEGENPDAALDMKYPLIHKSNNVNYPFLGAYAEFLSNFLGMPFQLKCNRPVLYLSSEEKEWMGQVQELVGGKPVKYWIVDAGVKSDFTCKQWPIEYYQEVVNRTRHLVEWVQIGASEHDHPLLDNVIDLRGQTEGRKFVRLVYHSQGGLGPVTYLQHLCAAWKKPYMCLLGGREPVTWVTYPLQTTFHSMGQLDCCRSGACWKSRVLPLEDKSKQDDSLCEQPVPSGIRPVGRCMKMITPDEVVAVLRKQMGDN